MKALGEESTTYDLTQSPTLLMNTDTSQMFLSQRTTIQIEQQKRQKTKDTN